MSPKDYFQTSLRIAGVILLFYSVPRALADLLSILPPGPVGGAGFVLGMLVRLLWGVGVPLWLIGGAQALTRRIYGSG